MNSVKDYCHSRVQKLRLRSRGASPISQLADWRKRFWKVQFFWGAFAFLQALSSGRIGDFIARDGGADQILHFGSRNTKRLTIRTACGDLDGCELHFNYDGRDSLSFGMPRSTDKGDERCNTIDLFGSWRCYHFLDTGFHSPMKKNLQIG